MDVVENKGDGTQSTPWLPRFLEGSSPSSNEVLYYELFLDNQQRWSQEPLDRVLFKPPTEEWQRQLVHALTNSETVSATTQVAQPDSITDSTNEVRTPLHILENELNSAKESNSAFGYDPFRRYRNHRPEFGIVPEVDTEGNQKITLKPIDLIRLRRYRVEDAGWGFFSTNSMGKVITSNCVLKHVARLTDETLKQGISMLNTRGIWGNPNADQPTYLQWADKDVTTYNQFDEEANKMIVLLIDPFRLAQTRNAFVDPETFIHEYSSKGHDGRIMEFPGDSVMVFGGIPKEAIVGVEFPKENRSVAYNTQHTGSYFVDIRSILSKI